MFYPSSLVLLYFGFYFFFESYGVNILKLEDERLVYTFWTTVRFYLLILKACSKRFLFSIYILSISSSINANFFISSLLSYTCISLQISLFSLTPLICRLLLLSSFDTCSLCSVSKFSLFHFKGFLSLLFFTMILRLVLSLHMLGDLLASLTGKRAVDLLLCRLEVSICEMLDLRESICPMSLW